MTAVTDSTGIPYLQAANSLKTIATIVRKCITRAKTNKVMLKI